MKNIFIIIIALVILPFTAGAGQIYIEDLGFNHRHSNSCERHFRTQERAHEIPAGLLKSVSQLESGLRHQASGKLLPWPWTLNVEGKGYFYKNKKEALAAVKAFQKDGYRSIDVGCMQVNLRHHGHHFDSVEQALEPRHNIAYGAKFLKNNYDRQMNWKTAVAHYHSQTPEFGGPYSDRVMKMWGKGENMLKGKTMLASNSKVGQKRAKAYITVKDSKYVLAKNNRVRAPILKAKDGFVVVNDDSAKIARLSRNAVQRFGGKEKLPVHKIIN